MCPTQPALLAALLCLPACAAPPAAPDVPDGAWAGVLQSRPRLLGPADFLRSLAQAKPDLYREIRGHVGDNQLAAGIVNAVDGLTPQQIGPFLESARKDVARGVTNDHQDTWLRLTNVALTYDLFHDGIPAGDRRAMVDWFNAHLGKFTIDEGAFHNSTLSKVLCYLRVAYATWGENPQAQTFRDEALVRLYQGKLVPVLGAFGQGGGYTECGWYTRGSLWHLVQALELARRVEGYDGYQQAPEFFYQRLAYELFQPYPGLWREGYGAERYPLEGDGSLVYGGHVEYPRHTREVLAQYFRGSELSRAVANQRRKGSNFEARLVDFLIEEDPDPPLDLNQIPPAHLAAGIGKVYARSDWTDDATWFRLECGDFWNHHQHFETGNFEIYRRAPLATESGEYADYNNNHAVNWLLRTIAHNCLLIYQPDETWSQLRDGGRNTYANDGGQTKKWEWTVDNLEQWQAKRVQFERGDIVAYHHQPEFLYVAGDCTAAYVPTKLQSWVRQIVFLRPHTFVVFDRVVATRADYPKTWLLHCQNEPAIDGHTFTVTNGGGRLVAQTLLPADAAIAAIEGYTYGGQTFDPPHNVQSDVAPKWRVEVRPGAARQEDLFLHVLTTDEPQPAELLRDGDRVGARVGEAEVWFSDKVGGELHLGGRTEALQAEVEVPVYN